MVTQKPPRRRRWIGAGGALLIVGGGALALGPAAPWLVDHALDGQRVWRLGRIDVDGVSGSWLGGLRARSITLTDGDGVWLQARNAALDWSPQDLLFGDVRMQRAHVEAIALLRMPTLLERRPPSRVRFDAHLGDIRVETLTLAEEVVGEAASFSGGFSLAFEDGAVEALALELRRTDSDDDRAIITYRATPDFALNADIQGAAGGVLSHALRVPEDAVTATASGEGANDGGEARYAAAIGDAQLLSGSARWTAERWSHEAQAQLDLLPAYRLLAHRIGASVAVAAEGEREGRFTANAETPFMRILLRGRSGVEDGEDFRASVTATTQRVSDIAHESPFELGPARIEGELRRARGTLALEATLLASEVAAFGDRAQFSGPLNAALTNERFSLDADVRVAENSLGLFADARLLTQLAYDRTRGRFSLDRAELTGDAIAVDAQGWVTRQDGELSGDWRVRRLGEIIPDLTGQASGHWRAFPEPAVPRRIWITTVSGGGADVAGERSVLAQFLGATPQLDGRFRYENGGITVSHARINGAKGRAGGVGRIVRGQANIALELSAQGPIAVGEATIDGAADATGRLTGRIVRPTVSATAHLSSFAAGGVTVERPIVEFVLAPSGRNYVGSATVTGGASGQPVSGSADIAFANDALSLTNIDAQWGGMLAQGSAAFASRGVSATLDFNGAFDGLFLGATGRAAGALALTPDAVTLDAQLADARAGELYVRTATVHASGPVRTIAARYSLRGRLRRAPLAFAGTATVDAAGGLDVRADGRGTLANVDVFTRAPMELSLHRNNLDASLNLAVGDGAVIVGWREHGEAVSAAAQIEDAPLAPLAAIWDERAVGRIDGDIELRNVAGGLAGSADLTLTGARFAARQRAALDMHVVGELAPDRLSAVVDATSADGLVAHFDADAPVSTRADPLRIALMPERRGSGRWSVRGPAESLWAAARLQDQSLAGQLDGAGEIQFGAGYLSGAGNIEIVDGRFEDKLSGVTLVDLDARLALGSNGVTIERFTASGARGGRLTASGGSTSSTEGRIELEVDNIRVANRPDARARASGRLALIWRGLHSEVAGALEIAEAELDVAANPSAGIATLDVIEVNRAGVEDEPAAPRPRRNGSTDIDVRITAPGRVYTRGRGVDAEWTLDLRLTGTASSPRLFGEARAVRGTLALSGQPFEIDDARILFNGDPLDAQIDLTATRDTSDLTARVRLTGTARDPEITFTSDPPLPEDEILPQVLFGRSVQDLSPFEAAQLAASLAALSGRASLDLLDAARSAAGLDRLNVREDQAGGLLVAGGVYLTRDVYVELARTGLGETQTRVEWTVRPRLVLITSFLGNGDQRVSLRWRRESD